MSGLALKLFRKEECKAALHEWPFLEYLVDHYDLNAIDLKLGVSALKQYSPTPESVGACLFHLSLAARNGHLTIQVENDCLLPTISSLIMKEATLSDDDLQRLEDLSFHGALEILNNARYHGLFSSYLRRFENCIYFQRNFHFETVILTHLMRIQKSIPTLKIDESVIQNKIDTHPLSKEQRDAILLSTKNCLTLITGGPGTGKSYTASYLLKLFQEIFKSQIKIAVAAPTGKAAAHLQKSLGDGFTSMTLHQLLGVKENGQLKSDHPVLLNADLILVDESSMIDAFMMGRLLSLVKPGARMIFLGDSYQLPSVDAGAIFSDLLQSCPENRITLQKCLRAELDELISFGKAINEGNSSQVFEMLKKGESVKKLELKENETLFQHVEKHFLNQFKETDDPQVILDSFNQFRILCPLRKGPFGVDALNKEFFLKMVKKATSNFAVPIMLLRNDQKLQLFNGEVGVLVIDRHFEDISLKQGDYALFPCKKNGFKKFPALILPTFEYAYCMSVHKAQGSEFNHVLCLLPEKSEYFGREVLYTAVTRAKRRLEIFGTDEVLLKTIQNKSCRLSGLEKRIRSLK